MDNWPTPKDKAERLFQLSLQQLIGFQPEVLFDAIAQTTASSCNAPISLVSLVGERDQWFRRRVLRDGKWVDFCH